MSMKALKIAACCLVLSQLVGCAMTPEQRQAMAQAMSNYHPYVAPQVQPLPVPKTTTTNCITMAPGQVTCTSQSN
jgi:hypothetical protein